VNSAGYTVQGTISCKIDWRQLRPELNPDSSIRVQDSLSLCVPGLSHGVFSLK